MAAPDASMINDALRFCNPLKGGFCGLCRIMSCFPAINRRFSMIAQMILPIFRTNRNSITRAVLGHNASLPSSGAPGCTLRNPLGVTALFLR